MSRFFFSLSIFLYAATLAVAQTWTDCNPLNSTKCPSDTALGTSYTFNFTDMQSASTKIWNTTAGTVNWGNYGAEFTINKQHDSPTMQSNFYIFFGKVSVTMRCATGQGIVSSFVLQSDDLDEVDWEWLGGNSTIVETNYFGKGNTTSYDRATWNAVDNPQEAWHNYTIDWTKEKLEWYIDDDLIRTLKYEDALDGYNFPQTPMNLRLGVWAGGDPELNSQGTVDWAQGAPNYSDGPFTMIVKSLYVEDYSNGSSYSYGDTSGSYDSIKIEGGNSTISKELNKVHGIKAKFSNLPKWAQGVILAVVLGGAAVGAVVFCFCCLKARSAGKKERMIQDQEWEKTDVEMELLKQRMRRDYQDGVPMGRYDPKKLSMVMGK